MGELEHTNNLQEPVPSSRESLEAEPAISATQGAESTVLNIDVVQAEPTPTIEVNQEEKNKIKKPNIARAGFILLVSIILTFPSMAIIKSLPNNNFATIMDFVATILLVVIVWFLLIRSCVWLVEFLMISQKSKKNPSRENVELIKTKKGSMKTLSKILIGILNVALAYFTISFIIAAAVFSWFPVGGPVSVPEKRPAWVLAMLPFFSFGLIMISCAITDLIMMIKLKRNPSDEKSKKLRKKAGSILLISFIVSVCLILLELVIITIMSSK